MRISKVTDYAALKQLKKNRFMYISGTVEEGSQSILEILQRTNGYEGWGSLTSQPLLLAQIIASHRQPSATSVYLTRP